MKSSQKVTKLKLNIEQDNDYLLLGLVSAEPDYKLSADFQILMPHQILRFPLFQTEPAKIFFLISSRTSITFY
jgi:hypothetical protein